MIELIQVCWDMNTKILEQETRALKEAMKHFDLKEAFVITGNHLSTEDFNDHMIRFVLLHQWSIKVKNE